MTRLLPLLLLLACDDPRLHALPEAGPVAEEGVRDRDPLEAGPPPRGCGISLVWPYDFPPLGECAPGWLDTCTGEQRFYQGPREDVCGNGLDEDCDGVADDEGGDRAILLILDVSGSMTDRRAHFAEAVCAHASQATGEQWALVVFGAGPDQEDVPLWFFAENFAPGAQHVCQWLRSAPWTSWPQGGEYLGAVSLEAVGAVSWPTNHARHIIAVTDEEPHAMPGEPGDGVDLLQRACEESGALLSVVTNSPWRFYYQGAISSCGGDAHILGWSASSILEVLTLAAAMGC